VVAVKIVVAESTIRLRHPTRDLVGRDDHARDNASPAMGPCQGKFYQNAARGSKASEVHASVFCPPPAVRCAGRCDLSTQRYGANLLRCFGPTRTRSWFPSQSLGPGACEGSADTFDPTLLRNWTARSS
jgi:hypothetical protein